MRTPRLALLAGTAVLAGLLAVPSSAADAPAHTAKEGCVDSVPETDPLEAGPVQICYTVFQPATATPDEPVPMVLHSHGWGGSRTRSLSSFQAYLDAGFGVLSFDQRGFGQSGGKAHVEDPVFEGQDVIAVVDEVARFDWVRRNGPNDPVLGAIGGSYGGGYQFVGAFTELRNTGKTRFDALAPEITWFSLNESLAPEDVVRTTWTAALYAAGANAHTSTVHAGFAEGTGVGNWPATMEEFFADNGPSFHVAEGRQLDIPVLFGQGSTDNLFPLEQGLKNFQQALTDKARRDSIFVGYNGGHVLSNALPAGFGTGGDACSAVVGKDAGVTRFSALARQFLTENLKGGPKKLTGHGEYHLTAADGVTCLTVDSTEANTTFDAGRIVTTAAAGAPQAVALAKGPLTVAGTPYLDATVTSLGLDSRAFFALSVGTSPADARVVQNNVRPHREASLNLGTARSIELPSIAVEVRKGQSLFLTVSPVSDMFVGHGSRTPSAMVLDGAKVRVPVVE
jgi:ABC-2 type transport system ATP-binding protein